MAKDLSHDFPVSQLASTLRISIRYSAESTLFSFSGLAADSIKTAAGFLSIS